MADCILPSKLDEMFQKIKDSGLTPKDLITDMDSQKRMEFLAEFLGKERAKLVDDLWKEKYIIPQQQENLEEWAKDSGKPISDRLMNKLRKLNKVLNPVDDRLFLEGLIENKLKFEISKEDAKLLSEKQAGIDAIKNELDNSFGKDYGTIDFDKFKDDVYKSQNKKESDRNKEDIKVLEQEDLRIRLGLAINGFNETYKELFHKNTRKTIKGIAEKTVGTLRTLPLSADTSFSRNISNMLFIYPGKTLKAVLQGHKLFWTEWGNKIWNNEYKPIDNSGYTRKDYMWADIYSNPNYINGNYRNLGIAVGITEEPFLGSVLSDEKGKFQRVAGKGGKLTRVISAIYPASEDSFEYAVSYARTAAADELIKVYKNDIQSMKDNDIGQQINQITGRWMPKDKSVLTPALADKISKWALAFRWTASRIATAGYTIYAPAAFMSTKKATTGKYFNTQNAIRGRQAIQQVIIMSLFSGLQRVIFNHDDDDDESNSWLEHWITESFDYRSSNAGKIVIGETRIDMTFGVASVLKLLTQMSTKEGKAAKTGNLYKADRGDTFWRWLTYRQSPTLQVMGTLYQQGKAVVNPYYLPEDIVGKPQTALAALRETVTPISFSSLAEYYYNKSGTPLEGALMFGSDFVGFSAQSYGDRSKTDDFMTWGKRSDVAKISEDSRRGSWNKLDDKTWEIARKEFYEEFSSKALNIINTEEFNNYSLDEQNSELQKLHGKILRSLGKKYDVYKK